MEELPASVAVLIQMLDKIYPTPEVRPGVDHDTQMYSAGQRSVVDRLLRLQKEATEPR